MEGNRGGHPELAHSCSRPFFPQWCQCRLPFAGCCQDRVRAGRQPLHGHLELQLTMRMSGPDDFCLWGSEELTRLEGSVMGRPADGGVLSVSAGGLGAVPRILGTVLGLWQSSQKGAIKQWFYLLAAFLKLSCLAVPDFTSLCVCWVFFHSDTFWVNGNIALTHWYGDGLVSDLKRLLLCVSKFW